VNIQSDRGSRVSIVVRCPNCLSEASVPEELHGHAVLCPRCSARFTAPEMPALRADRRADTGKADQTFGAKGDAKNCVECGVTIRRKAVVCPSCGVPQKAGSAEVAAALARPGGGSLRVVAGLLGIFLGMFGIHKFVLGYPREGLIMAAISVLGFPCSAGTALLAVWAVGAAEGVLYLVKSDAEFDRIYVQNRQPWF
jgi:TM2 domain-containing membrane protein YozV